MSASAPDSPQSHADVQATKANKITGSGSVVSTHPWFTWRSDFKVLFKFSIESEKMICEIESWYEDGKVIDNPQTPSELAEWITMVYSFTAVDFNISTDVPLAELQREGIDDVGVRQSFLNAVFDTPLGDGLEVGTVFIATCGCNMGYCSSPTAATVETQPGEMKTYRDVLRVIAGQEGKGEAEEYGDGRFPYPDSVMIDIEHFDKSKLPKVTCGYARNRGQTIDIQKLDPTKEYLTYSWGR